MTHKLQYRVQYPGTVLYCTRYTVLIATRAKRPENDNGYMKDFGFYEALKIDGSGQLYTPRRGTAGRDGNSVSCVLAQEKNKKM